METDKLLSPVAAEESNSSLMKAGLCKDMGEETRAKLLKASEGPISATTAESLLAPIIREHRQNFVNSVTLWKKFPNCIDYKDAIPHFYGELIDALSDLPKTDEVQQAINVVVDDAVKTVLPYLPHADFWRYLQKAADLSPEGLSRIYPPVEEYCSKNTARTSVLGPDIDTWYNIYRLNLALQKGVQTELADVENWGKALRALPPRADDPEYEKARKQDLRDMSSALTTSGARMRKIEQAERERPIAHDEDDVSSGSDSGLDLGALL